MKIQPYGDNALIIQLAKEASVEVSQQVIALYHDLETTGQFQYLIPAFASLTVAFDKSVLSFAKAEELIRSVAQKTSYAQEKAKHLTIPVCYEGPHAPDMQLVERITGLSRNEIVQLHTNTTFHVYMLGFIAGFPYLGNLPQQLHCERKASPRLKVPQGSVGLAGLQSGIYPTEAPGGWQLIGRTPLHLFNPKRDPPNLLKPGDKVQFREISSDEYQLINIKIETDIYQPEYDHG